jgi:hypothetical protein
MSGNAVSKNSGSAAIYSGERMCIGLMSSKEGDDDNEEWGGEGGMLLMSQSVRLRMAQL